MPIWNEKYECMSEDERRVMQGERLKKTVKRVYENVAPYRAKMDAIGLKPEDIHSVDDLKRLPFTLKHDLRSNYPYGMFASPMREIVRVHASSGTTGKQTVVGYTKNDLDVWSEVMGRTLSAAGADCDSTIQVCYGYGLFTGGLGAHYGAEYIGASTIPASAGNTKRQVEMLQDFGTTLLACTPSYALCIAEMVEELKVDKSKLQLRSGVFGAEPWTENMRREIDERLGIKSHDVYGLSEIIGPGVSFECGERNGLHVNEDHFLIEIIDPETGEVLPDGQQGEVVFTTITKEGLPLIRYRTRDISIIHHGQCACGRTLVKMEKPRGRSDDMLIIRGVNVFPSQIESVLLNIKEVAPHYQLIVDRVNNLDTLEILVEISEDIFSDKVRSIEGLARRISDDMHNALSLTAKIRLVEPKTIERSAGKAKRIIDKRELY